MYNIQPDKKICAPKPNTQQTLPKKTFQFKHKTALLSVFID